MGIAHRYVETADLIVTIWHGQVTSAQWADHARRQVSDPNWSQARKRLTDTTTADTSILTDVDARAIAAIYQPASASVRGVRHAIVAHHNREIAQQPELNLDAPGVTAIVFNAVAIATTWLSVDTDEVLATIDDLRRELRGRP
jgi:hypothetical protein